MARILIVEDNETQRMALYHLLKGRQHTVTAVCNGREAIVLLQQIKNFDVIITNCCIPIMDGLQLLAHVLGLNLKIPVILTGGSLPYSKQEYISLGFKAVFPKPLDIDQLTVTIQQVLLH